MSVAVDSEIVRNDLAAEFAGAVGLRTVIALVCALAAFALLATGQL